MRLRTKLIASYSLIVLLLTIVLGAFFRQSSLRRLDENAFQELTTLSVNMSNQLDEVVIPMQFVSEFLLSDSGTLSALNTLQTADKGEIAQGHIMRAKIELRSSLVTYSINEHFHRVNIFTGNGDFLTSNVRLSSVPDGDANPARVPGVARADAQRGQAVLMPPHPDSWSPDNPETVFSLLRAVKGGSQPCYIEVQKTYRSLEALYSHSGDIRTAVFSGRGELFFSQLTDSQNQILKNSLKPGVPTSPNAVYLDDGSIAAAMYSPYTDVYTVAVKSRSALMREIDSTNMMVFVTFFLAGLLSVIFVYIASQRLTTPIRQLTAQMENTELSPVESQKEYAHSNDEIKTLNAAYARMMHRLTQAAAREKQLGALQVQAEFDALQAQVNPHFIYNVLHVIAYRSMQSGDQTVCGICESLAAMLRYSTGTARRWVTIREELDYVKQYLALLSARYLDKLVCEVEIAPIIEDQMMPKIVLQQIVENAINHGFLDTSGTMRIGICGWTEEGQWHIRVEDNGCGFDAETLAQLGDKMRDIREKLRTSSERLEMDIGGLGLINAYARMYLLYGDEFIFSLSNRDGQEHGAVLEIGARMRTEVNP